MDYGDSDKSTNLDEDSPEIAWDNSIISPSDKKYLPPIASTATCSKVFTVNFMFQVSNQEDDSDTAIKDDKAGGGMHGIDLQGKSNNFGTVLDWLNNTDLADGTYGGLADIPGDQNVTSYFIVEPTKINTTTNGYAKSGGSNAAYEWSSDPEELYITLNGIFSQILSVSTTFTAASIPVSVLNRAQVVNNVYLALFQADPKGKPRWPGNLKKLKLDKDGILIDSIKSRESGLYSNAVATDGRIRHDALTYWTDASKLPAPDTDADEVEGRDGRAVARGGAGQKIPGFTDDDPGATNASGSRKMFYQTSSSSLAALEATSALASTLQTSLGADDTTEALEILKFIRGYDVNDEDEDGDTTDVRPWLLGDPLHSRPLPINYGARDTGFTKDTNPDIRILMGSNDGFMRMFQNTDSASNESGKESWAFLPSDLLSRQKILKANESSTAEEHKYGVDGAPAAYIDDKDNNGTISGSDTVWVYFGMRRGGQNMYAMDISDPDDPKLMWTITPSGDFPELGYTFSTPRTGLLDWGDGPKPVVMFAGGYSLNKDSSASNDSMGNAFYVVNAETGDLIWKAKHGATTGSVSSEVYTHEYLVNSIPSDITSLDTDGDGIDDRVYFGDTGGVVWRVDIHDKDRTKWKISGLASLGRMWDSDTKHDRRFFHRPDFVQYKDEHGPYDAVIIGSGNRADPKGTSTHDYFYVIKDRNIDLGTGDDADLVNHSELADLTSNCLQKETCTAPTELVNGWRLHLDTAGEKALATPTTILKRIYFTSYVPSDGLSTTCTPKEGDGYLYVVSLDDARAVNDYDYSNNKSEDTGESTDPDASTEVVVLDKSDRKEKLSSGGIPAEIVFIPDNLILRPDLQSDSIDVLARWKTFWYPVEE